MTEHKNGSHQKDGQHPKPHNQEVKRGDTMAPKKDSSADKQAN